MTSDAVERLLEAGYAVDGGNVDGVRNASKLCVSSRGWRSAPRDLPVEVKTFYVYMLSNRSRTVLYTGVTNSLERRIWFHRNNAAESFTKKYRVDRLVFYEAYNEARSAISREKEIKGWRRAKKNDLVSTLNPAWKDLSSELFAPGAGEVTRPRPRE